MSSRMRVATLFIVLTSANGCNWFGKKENDATKTTPPPATAKASPGKQEIDFGSGTRVNMDAVRVEAKAPVSFNSADDLQIRLKSGGTVSISESDLTTGDPNFGKRGLQFLALDTLELKKGARIVTGGNDLVIFANKITSEDGQIVAFTDKTKKAANASAAGGAGDPGVSGGTVTLVAINGIDGRLHVDLSGQNGGDGFKGAPGGAGVAGLKGVNASWFAVNCQQGGQNGGPGGPGQKGATGGPAGNGGHGGTLSVFNVGQQPVPTATVDFISNAGNRGGAGPGGDGGPGGPGGLGGSGGGPCSGGNAGPPGGKGADGEVGAPGVDGSKGNSLIKNMDLELLVKTVKQINLKPAS